MEVPRESSRVAASATRDLLWYITQSLRFFAMIFPPSAGCRRPNWVHFLFRSLAVQLPGGSLLHLSSCWGKKSPVVLTAPFFKKKKKKKKNSLPRWRWEMWQIKVRRQSCRINKNRRVVKKKVCGSNMDELWNRNTTLGHPVDCCEFLQPLDQVGFNNLLLVSGPKVLLGDCSD